MPEPAKPDYTRPADAPDCVQVVDGHYCAYFEQPRFCWDEPIWCKVRKAGDTTIDMQTIPAGIKDVPTFNGQRSMANENNWYDLQGRSISQPTQKGLYIVNGKKTVIK